MIASFFLAGQTRPARTVPPVPTTTEAATDFADRPAPAVNHQIILQRNIFGPTPASPTAEARSEEKPVSAPAEPSPRRQLALRLIGTVAGDRDVACAVVEDTRTKVQELYRAGDIVQGAQIESIERNRIVLLNEGVPETLDLVLASADDVRSPQPMKTREPGEATLAKAVKRVSPTEYQVNAQAILAAAGGIDAVLKVVKVSDHHVEGQPEGLQLWGLDHVKPARHLGLENGDVVQTINGQTVTDKRKAFQILRKARALSAADIQILHGKETRTVSLSMKS